MHKSRCLWVKLALACASLLFASTLFAADEKAAVLAEVNQTRQLMGLPAVAGNAQLDLAAQAHADYLQTHINGISHNETPGLSGFTGATPGARLTAAGYLFSSMNEVISGGVASGQQAVQGLVQAIYHRFGIFAPEVAEVGIGLGTAPGKFANVVIDFGATFGNTVTLPIGWLGTYPVDGQTGVTRDFNSDTEVPDPVPSQNRVGYPVSIHAGAQDTLAVTSFTLARADGGMSLPVQLLSFPADAHVPANAAAVVPLAPLDYGTRYQASFIGTRNGQAVSLSWTFTTATYVTLAVDLPYQRVGTGQVAQIRVGGGNGGSWMTGSSWSSFQTVTPVITEVSPGVYEVSVSAAAEVTVNFADQDGQTISAKVNFSDPTSQTVTLAPGWNLLGNGQDQPLAVASLFGNASNVTTVWKWDVATTGWQFYAPSMDATALQTYASGKGYGVLTSINPGEGFWVNVAQPFTVTFPAGVSLSARDFTAGKTYALKPNWNLVGIGNSLSPSGFNVALSSSLPVAGAVPVNLTTLWAWDNLQSKWYFYAPNLEGQGGTVLFDYTASKGYLDFTATGKTLGAGMGFWVNRP